MEIGAGYAFGSVEGTLLCLIGAAVGSSIIYLYEKNRNKTGGSLYFQGKDSIFKLY